MQARTLGCREMKVNKKINLCLQGTYAAVRALLQELWPIKFGGIGMKRRILSRIT